MRYEHCHQVRTNELHGDVFEFIRNGKLNARNFFAWNQDSLTRNQFGGSLGWHIKRGLAERIMVQLERPVSPRGGDE